LVKGKDDLRQDSVIEQIFQAVNWYLEANMEARNRKLSIRCFTVTPLSARSGVLGSEGFRLLVSVLMYILEWLEGTEPIGNWLVNAHSRYHPNEPTSAECRRKHEKASGSNRLQVYTEIEKSFTPVFRHFFFENFLKSHG
jgi:ataxia telangiectasia mutated family protein